MIKQFYQRDEGEAHDEAHQPPDVAPDVQVVDPHFSLYLHVERIPQKYPDLHQIVSGREYLTTTDIELILIILGVFDGRLLYVSVDDDIRLDLLIREDTGDHLVAVLKETLWKCLTADVLFFVILLEGLRSELVLQGILTSII